MRYLVIDDSPTMRKILIAALRTIGITDVVEAGDGEEGLAKIHAEHVDFVITDWNMPKMNGLELAKAVRGDDAIKNLPIIMVTTRDQRQDIMQAFEAQINNYIIKPFTPEILKDKIDTVLMVAKELGSELRISEET
mgnify:CR=1 FL=1